MKAREDEREVSSQTQFYFSWHFVGVFYIFFDMIKGV